MRHIFDSDPGILIIKYIIKKGPPFACRIVVILIGTERVVNKLQDR